MTDVGVGPGSWLTGRPGLPEAVEVWADELAPVRAAVPERARALVEDRRRSASAVRFATVVATLVAAGLATLVLDGPRALVGRRSLAAAGAHRLRRAFERLGPSYLKLGQFISSGRGLFPDVLVDEFAACRDRCPPVSTTAARAAVVAALGPLDQHFASFDDVPLAAASMAQVHAATLLDGTRVVVKVRRPGVVADVESHLASMRGLAVLVGRAFPRAPIADPQALLSVFATTIVAELDFRLEAQNMVDIGRDLEAAGVDDVVVPRPVPGLVTPSVLVMERLDGLRFDDLEAMQAAGIDTTALLLAVLRSVIEGATVFGRFHGDLHAGNVIALPGGRFGLVDFGICARLDERERVGLRRLLRSIAAGDPRNQVWALDSLGALPPESDRRRLIATLVAAQRTGAERLSADDLAAGAPEVMAVFRDHELRPPAALVLFFKDVLYLNGSTRLLAPDLDLLGAFAGLAAHFEAKYGEGAVAHDEPDPYGPPVTEAEVATALEAAVAASAPPTPTIEPTLSGVVRRFGREGAVSIGVPIVVFTVLDQLAGLVPAIIGVTTWSVGLAVLRRRGGRRTGPLVWITLALVLLRGTLGAASGSGLVYFAPDILTSWLIASLFLGSVAVGRPLIAAIAQAFHPFVPEVRRHPTFRRVFTRLSLAWGGFLLASGGFQLWLLLTQSPTTYVIARRAVSLPLGIVLFTISLRYPQRAFRQDPSLAALLPDLQAPTTPLEVTPAP